jgi:hypothetical protein
MPEFTSNQLRWLDELQSTDKEQGSGLLKERVFDLDGKEVDHYCCLGIAEELAGTPAKLDDNIYMFLADIGNGKTNYCESGALTRAGRKWLGTTASDPACDVPPNTYLIQGPPNRLYTPSEYLYPLTASGMNDSGQFTFKQIADMFRYFGFAA